MTDIDAPEARESLHNLRALVEGSYDLIVHFQDESGAYPASPTFSAYRGYSWFRDGAFIADAVSAFGGVDSAERFFDWCARVLTDRSADVETIVSAARAGHPVADSEMLGTRFALDGADGADEWWDFQLDGYGTWLWAAVAHADRHGRSLTRWLPAIELTVDYLVSSWSRPCFDWWEENADRVHVSTLGCVAAGLRAVAGAGVLGADRQLDTEQAIDSILALIREQGTTNGHLAKWLGSAEVDASLASLISPLALFPAGDPLAAPTIAALDAQLNVGGGVHRYLRDTFYGGGQWPLLSCMLGLGFAALGQSERAASQLEWAAEAFTESGDLPEQVDGHLLDASFRAEWIERWGTVATPLLWSHAMFIRLAVELGLVEGGHK